MKLPARIYIDDALVLALSKCHMKQVFAALIEAIFVIMGKPDTRVRQCPLALDKWAELIVAPRQRMLGLLIELIPSQLVYLPTTSRRSST